MGGKSSTPVDEKRVTEQKVGFGFLDTVSNMHFGFLGVGDPSEVEYLSGFIDEFGQDKLIQWYKSN